MKGTGIINIINFIELYPDVSENEVVTWLKKEGFVWENGDDKKFGDLLIERDWKNAAKQFRWSWKAELKAVAWHAKSLLGYWETFWFSPMTGPEVYKITKNNMSTKKETQMVKVLFLASNPMVSTRLAIDEEARLIEEKVQLSKLRDAINFKTKWAVRPEDLQQTLLEEEPTIVHFSGHGGGKIGIVLHSSDHTEENLVSSEALADLFKVLKENISVVVLNACYSEEQSKAIVKEIDFVIGMSNSIGDEAARVFAAAFYRGLAYGKTVQTSFDLGLNELKLMNLKTDETVPVLLVKEDLDASSVTLIKSDPHS